MSHVTRFLSRIFMLPVFLLVIGLLGSTLAFAGEQAERALHEVRRLIETGAVPAKATIKVAFKPGNIAALLGPELELQKEWENKTGIRISARIIAQRPALQNLAEAPEIDLTVARNHELVDLFARSLIQDLSPLLKEHGFRLPDAPPQGYIHPQLQTRVGEYWFAIPADGNIPLLYLRSDLMQASTEREAFRKRYGRELRPPETWDEYLQLIEFFHRPQLGLFGTSEERNPENSWMFWLQRYLSYSPTGRLFDDQLKPLLDTPAGIAATENFLATIRFSPPEILQPGKDYSYAMPLFMQGKAFATIATIAAAKLFNSETSAVRGKYIAVPLPGKRQGKEIVRRITPIYGNNLVVSAHGEQQRLAFLFAMWVTDPDNSLRTVGVKGGHTDPYRWHHVGDPRIRQLYGPGPLDSFVKSWSLALPSGTGLPGDGEYLEVLNEQLALAARGIQDATAAMRRTVQEWEKISQRLGRAKQMEWHQRFLSGVTSQE